MRSEAASQDTGLSVLVATARVKARAVDFSVKGKDEARVPTVFGAIGMPSFSHLLRG